MARAPNEARLLLEESSQFGCLRQDSPFPYTARPATPVPAELATARPISSRAGVASFCPAESGSRAWPERRIQGLARKVAVVDALHHYRKLEAGRPEAGLEVVQGSGGRLGVRVDQLLA